MRIFNDKHNFVICKSKRLLQYIKEKYKEIKTIEYYNGENSDSDYLILDPSYNTNEIIFKLPYKNKFILQPDCNFIPTRRWLFKHSKKDSVLNPINPKNDKYYSNKKSKTFYEIKQDENYLDYDKLIEVSNKGINTSILSGYGVYNVAMNINKIDYLYKEEYKMDARISKMQIDFNYITHESYLVVNLIL